MSEPSKRGGKRAGAGRKPAAEARYITASVRLTDEHVDLMYETGNGNASLGLRILLDELIVRRRAPHLKSSSKHPTRAGIIQLSHDDD